MLLLSPNLILERTWASISTRAATSSGWLSAKSSAIVPPMEVPTTTAGCPTCRYTPMQRLPLHTEERSHRITVGRVGYIELQDLSRQSCMDAMA